MATKVEEIKYCRGYFFSESLKFPQISSRIYWPTFWSILRLILKVKAVQSENSH